MVEPLIEKLRGGLIVSCQAGASDAIFGSAAMADMARAAALGGAVGIRANGPADIAAIRAAVDLPIIGIYKRDLPGLGIRITPTLEDVAEIIRAGATLVAVDATRRGPEEGRLAPAEFIPQIKREFGVPVMADIATYEEGIAAAEAGADIVATTLSGYTAYSPAIPGPDFDLLARLAAAIPAPVIAEGRIATPEHARRLVELGAFAVVVGSMITRPRWITEQYAAALRGMMEQRQPVIAIDIGGTKIAGCIVDASGAAIHLRETPTHADEGGDAVVARILDLIAALRDETGQAAAIGVSTSGEVDSTGRISYATGFMPGYMGQPLAERIRARFGLLCAVENDGQAATLGEARFGAGRGYPSVLGITVGTGIGGGFVSEGRIFEGATRAGLSLGHVTVEPGGRLCTCGRRGCLEAYASGPALLDAYNAARPAEAPATSGVEVLSAVLAGHREALDALDMLCNRLAIGIANALVLFNPGVVVIGGGVAQLGGPFFTRLRSAVQDASYPTVRETPILPAQLGTQAGLFGAAELARRTLSRG